MVKYRFLQHLILGVFGVTLAIPPNISAAAPGIPVVSSAMIRGHARLTFEWPRHTYIETIQEGKQLVIRFDRTPEIDTSELTALLPDFIEKVYQDKGNKQLILTLRQPVRTRSFITENITGVDLIPEKDSMAISEETGKSEIAALSPAAGVTVRMATNTPPDHTESAIPAHALTPMAGEDVSDGESLPIKNEAQTGENSSNNSTTENALEPPIQGSPINNPPENPTENPAENKDRESETLAVTSQQQQIAAEEEIPSTNASTNIAPDNTTTSQQAETTAEITPIPSADTKAVPQENSAQATDTPSKNSFSSAYDTAFPLQPEFINEIDYQLIRFPWEARTAIAAFERQGYGWIAFNENANVDLSLLQKMPTDFITDISILPSESGTILRFKILPGVSMSVAKQLSNNFSWEVTFAEKQMIPNARIRPRITRISETKAYVFVPVLETSDPITVTDPIIGDTLAIIPFYPENTGIYPKRTFVDFTLLNTAQGVAVQAIADTTQVQLQRNGLRISSEHDNTLTSDLPLLDIYTSKLKDTEANNVLFSNEEWTLPAEDSFFETVIALQSAIVAAESDTNRLEARINLMEWYMAHGLFKEALGIIAYIQDINPKYFIEKKLSAHAGVASFMTYRFRDASRFFSLPELEKNDEIKMWRELTNTFLGGESKPFDFIDLNETFIKQYPPMFRHRLAIVAIDKYIRDENYNAALKVLNNVDFKHSLTSYAHYVEYLNGKLAIATGQTEEGMSIWKNLTEDFSDPYVQARTELALITEQLRLGEITKQDAIEVLEGLQLSWRGDELERGTLFLLAELYEESEAPVASLLTWRKIADTFPGTTAANRASRRMRQAFLKLFLHEEHDLSTLDQIALFYQYEDLTPPDAEGDKVIDKLADRLIALDLLDQAASLLEQRVRFYYQREKRSELGMKLAEVYLLNRMPGKALEAMENSVYGNNDEHIQEKRDILTAQILGKLGRYQNALKLLDKYNKTPLAMRAKIGIHWDNKQWDALINVGEMYLREREDPTAELTETELDTLMKLSLAYQVQQDTKQLMYLQDYFVPLIPEEKQPEFIFLTSVWPDPTPKNFNDMVSSLSGIGEFIAKYHTTPKMSAKMQPDASNTSLAEMN